MSDSRYGMLCAIADRLLALGSSQSAPLRQLSICYLPLPSCRRTVSIKAIRKTIALAKQHEAETGHLEKLLQHCLDRGVHLAIRLPAENPARHLLEFATAYIDHVPDFLEAARAITHGAHIDRLANPFLKLAEDFFLKPPELLGQRSGLDELLDEAYLAHRLLEEVNDHYMASTGIPLIPLDTTVSNLIVHHLIGEPFANELDEAVSFAVSQVTRKTRPQRSRYWQTYRQAHDGNHWRDELDSWPCLTDTLSIKLQLPGMSSLG